MHKTKWKTMAVAVVALGASGTASLAAYIHQQAVIPQSVGQENTVPPAVGSAEEPCAALEVSAPKYIPSTYPSLPLYNPLWLSPTQLIDPNKLQASVINTTTGAETPLNAVNAVIQEQQKAAGHQELPLFPAFLRLSPDCQWLLWASGTNEHPTWTAMTIEGTQRREWERSSSDPCPLYAGGGGVAWMRDSAHWVEVGQGVRQGQLLSYVRLYSIDTPQVREFPLHETGPDARLPAFPQFLFTTDGHAWMVSNSGGGPGAEPGVLVSNAEYYELLPGPDVWTLRHTTLPIQAIRAQAGSDEFNLSPDGRWLVWRDNSDYADKRARIILSRPDGSQARTLFETTHFLAFLHWTPDEKNIVFHWDGSGGIATAPNGEGMYAIALEHLDCSDLSSERTARRQSSPGLFPMKAGQRWQTLIAKNSAL